MSKSIASNAPLRDEGKIDLPAQITKAGSKQTYYTLRFLADRDRVQDALRAYAYFRWVDDLLDTDTGTKDGKQAFINAQRALLEACCRGELSSTTTPEEQMLVALVNNNPEKNSGLYIYLTNMMDVMAFDVERRGRLITQAELSQYSLWLSKAVTEYMFYFIGHNDPSPQGPDRYQAVYGAHMVHMLRDMQCDLPTGYYNVPAELLDAQSLSLDNLNSLPFRSWVCERVQEAHQCFEAGRSYIAKVKNLHCRLAGFAYLARFEWMLRSIEQDQYCLRAAYPERKRFSVMLWMAGYVLSSGFNLHRMGYHTTELISQPDPLEER